MTCSKSISKFACCVEYSVLLGRSLFGLAVPPPPHCPVFEQGLKIVFNERLIALHWFGTLRKICQRRKSRIKLTCSC